MPVKRYCRSNSFLIIYFQSSAKHAKYWILHKLSWLLHFKFSGWFMICIPYSYCSCDLDSVVTAVIWILMWQQLSGFWCDSSDLDSDVKAGIWILMWQQWSGFWYDSCDLDSDMKAGIWILMWQQWSGFWCESRDLDSDVKTVI